jgi:dTDP-4-dehydrorhamnose reductase
MKILITGANGYVGKSLYAALKDKYKITTLTRKELDLNNSSQVNDFFKNKYFDVVLHCAVKGGLECNGL